MAQGNGNRAVGAAVFGTALTLPFAASAAWAAPTCACGGASPSAAPDEVKVGEHLARAPAEAVEPPPAHPPAPPVEPEPLASAPPEPAAAEPEPVPLTVKPREHQALRPDVAEAPPVAAAPAPEPEPPAPPTPDVSGMSADAAERWLAGLETREPEPPPEPDPVPPDVSGMSADAAERWLAGLEAATDEPPPEPPPEPAPASPEPIAADELPPPPEDAVRVMTYNIGRGASYKHGKGTDPNELDEVADLIADSEADVVALQEAYTGVLVEPPLFTPNDTEVITRRLSEEHGVEYEVVNGPATIKWELDDNIFRDPRYGDFGNALLVRVEGDVEGVIEDSEENEQLPSDGDEGRTLTGAEIEVDGTPIHVFSTHISSQDPPDEDDPPDVIDPQAPQIGAVMDEMESLSGPVILAGDFNVTLGSSRPSAQEINRFDEVGLTDAAAEVGATSTCGEGNRIDYIFTRDLIPVAAYNVECGPSDHNAVVVDVRLEDE